MSSLQTEANGRYERKFIVHDAWMPEVTLLLRNHFARFSEIYPDRRINNVYFDNHNLESYHDSVDGLRSRYKARVRWYGKIGAQAGNPVYELKVKKGLLGWKYKYPVEDFALTRTGIRNMVRNFDRDCRYSPVHTGILKRSTPILVNSYTRKYLGSADNRYRLTLDTDHRVYDIHSMRCSNLSHLPDRRHGKIILEIKYTPDDDSHIDAITNAFPFRLSRSSKYVDSLNHLYL